MRAAATEAWLIVLLCLLGTSIYPWLGIAAAVYGAIAAGRSYDWLVEPDRSEWP